MSRLQHFCPDNPREAACGYYMGPRAEKFTDEATSCFAAIDCGPCRRWVWENYLKPRGFKVPAEWGWIAP